MNNLLIENDLIDQREGFKIENLEGATWAFRKLRAIENKEADIKAISEEEMARITSWRDAELKQYEADKQYFSFLLEEYYKNEKAKDKKFKLSTPYGKVTARKSSKWNYENEEALVKYLKDNKPELVRVKEEVNKTELKKVFKNGVDKETDTPAISKHLLYFHCNSFSFFYGHKWKYFSSFLIYSIFKHFLKFCLINFFLNSN